MNVIELSLSPKAKDIGDNFIVRRSLPDHRKRMVGPFIFWDHMGPVELKPGNEMKVRAHPHIGLATITYLFSGEIMHRDSLGNEQPIKPGEVNWMTAGKGIVHSERSKALSESILLEGIQLWLALPKESEQVDPSFYHCKEKDLPLIEKNGVKLRLIAGEFEHEKSPVPVYSKLFYLAGEMNEQASFEYQLEENEEAAFYVIDGNIEVENQTFERFEMVIFKAGSKLKINATKKSRLMFFGGAVFPEKRHIWWNFVATSKELIEVAKLKWQNNEFDKVINETEIIPLPEN